MPMCGGSNTQRKRELQTVDYVEYKRGQLKQYLNMENDDISDKEDDRNDNSLAQDSQQPSKKRKEQPSPENRSDKKHNKSKRVRGIDDEAQQSDDEEGEGNSSDDSGEEEDDTQYEEDGFLVRDDARSGSDDSEESGSENDSEAEAAKKRKLQRLKKRRDDVQLDEEDELLIRENAALKQGGRKGRIADNSDGEEGSVADDGEIAPEVRMRAGSDQSDEDDEGATAPAQTGKDRAADAARRDQQKQQQSAYFEEDDEGSDMGGFIVDEDEEGEGDDADGAAGANARKARPSGEDGRPQVVRRRTGRKEGPTYDQLQEAMDIFGQGFDDFSDEEEGRSDAEESDEDGQGDGRVTTDKLVRMSLEKDGEFLESIGDRIELGKKDQRRIQKLRSRFERAHLVATFCTSRDDVLRRVDKPERLQQVLVGRDTPQDAERVLEARWMAAKLAARMIADDHLNPSRETVRHTANPVAANSSPLYSYGSAANKEDTLRRELAGPIQDVLRYLQVDLYEVPFIWSYRRDYLHPVMTREHLWLIFSLEEDWDSTVETKMRLSEEVSALADAAMVAGKEGTLQDEEEGLARLQSDIRRQAIALDAQQSDMRLAEAEVQQAMDTVDEKDEPTAEDRERVTACSAEAEHLQAAVKEATEQLRVLREEEAALQARLRRRSRFRPAAAKETLRLFPADRYMAMVRDTTDDLELRDVMQFFRLLAQNAEVGDGGAAEEDETAAADGAESQGPRRTHNKKALRLRRNEYARYKNNEALRRFVEQIASPVHEFGDGMRHGFRPEVPPTPETKCDEQARLVAASSPQFSSEQAVFRAARIVIGTELSMEPSVRSAARAAYRRVILVSTRPTPKGKTIITPFHELFGLHLLDRKPLRDFYAGADRTLYIRLAEAEREGLITISFDLPLVRKILPHTNPDGSTGEARENEVPDLAVFLSELKMAVNFMPAVGVNEDIHPQSRPSWDRERLLNLQNCLDNYLCPSLEQEVRRELVRIGKEVIVQQAGQNFSAMLSVGPYVPPYQDFRERIRDTLRACPDRPFHGTVAAIFVSLNRQDPLCMAYVNKDGVLRAHDLLPTQAMNQKSDRIKRFLIENRPDLVVINASGAGASRSTAVVIEKSILKEVEEEVKRRDFARREGRMEGVSYADDDEEFVPYKAQVMIVKDELPRIFMNSPRSKDMFSDLQPGEAAAVCLARYAQEPLAEYCCAWKSASSQEIFGHELLFLKVHPLVDLLRGVKQSLLTALEHRLVDAVCDVGVDVNRACAYDHLAPMLAFVGGLGLRKADALRQNIRKGVKAITSRNDLLLRKLLGTSVWTNAAGFLRVCGENVNDPLDNTRIHPECYSTYDFATKICADALEVSHSQTGYVANVEKLMASSRKVLLKRMERHDRWVDLWEHGQRPIPGVTPYDDVVRTSDGKEHPLSIELSDMLAQLELDDYAAELEQSGQGKRRLLFEQIKDELRFPCLDLRLPLAGWTPQEMFFLLTGHTDRSMFVGMKVGGTVLEVSDTSMLDERTGQYKRRQRAVVQTDAGMRGFVSMYDAVDTEGQYNFSFETFNLSELLCVGKHIEAVVVGVKKDKLTLDLSIKPSHLDKPESWWLENRRDVRQAREWWESQGRDPERLFDKYFREGEALHICREEEKSQQQNAEAVNQQLSASSLGGARAGAVAGTGAGAAGSSGRSLMRVVHHPLFANLDFKAAEERMKLEGKGAGEVLIRPSSKGPNHLTITWAFQDGWYKHISVEERGKRAGDLGVGPQLFVQEDDLSEPYHDLDELFSRYIEPMNDLVSVVLKHRSFRKGTAAEVEAMMFAERAENPQRIPYFFRFEPSKPGTFVLTWLSVNIKSESPVKILRIEVRPYGLRAQGEVFVRPSDLIMWFKETEASQSAKQLADRSEARRATARASAVNAANNAARPPMGMGVPAMGAPPVEPVRRSRFHN